MEGKFTYDDFCRDCIQNRSKYYENHDVAEKIMKRIDDEIRMSVQSVYKMITPEEVEILERDLEFQTHEAQDYRSASPYPKNRWITIRKECIYAIEEQTGKKINQIFN